MEGSSRAMLATARPSSHNETHMAATRNRKRAWHVGTITSLFSNGKGKAGDLSERTWEGKTRYGKRNEGRASERITMKLAHKTGERSSLKTYFQKFFPPP